MFQSISINNFKAFSTWQEIKLAPITLIYGPNSSGKSSIIHALMLLKQSITRPSQQGGLVSNGEYVDLGDFFSMVHGHDPSKDIGFKISYVPAKKRTHGFSLGQMFGTSHLREYTFDYGYSGSTDKGKYGGFTFLKNISMKVKNTSDKAEVFEVDFVSGLAGKDSESLEKRVAASKTFKLNGSESRNAMLSFLGKKSGSKNSTKSEKLLDQTLDVLDFKSDLNFATPSLVSFESKVKISPDINSFITLNITLSELANDLKQKFGSITYLGPLRSHPSRFYAPRGDQDESVGKLGENVARFIYEKSPDITHEINTWFKSFEIPYILSAASIGNEVSGPVICLQLEDLRTRVVVGPSDVGFGIGQILPVIVEGIVKSDSVICVEQPEIHLHPRLQAHLANFIVDTSSKNQWIIETHSEALILRLQNLIRGKKVSPKDISIVYVDPTETGGNIIHIPLDEDGDFKDEWPEGFFDERVKEKLRV